MQAVCFLYSNHGCGQERMIALAEGAVIRYTEVQQTQKRTCGISRWVTTSKVDHYVEANRCTTFQELGDIDICGRDCLVVVGGRDSVLELFIRGNVERTIKVDKKSVTVGVFREQKMLHGDVFALKIDCGSPVSKEQASVFGKYRIKKGNLVHTSEIKSIGHKVKSFDWNTIDITRSMGLAGSGQCTVHPLEFHGPIKSIFDNHNW